jgi:hypothetical protein
MPSWGTTISVMIALIAFGTFLDRYHIKDDHRSRFRQALGKAHDWLATASVWEMAVMSIAGLVIVWLGRFMVAVFSEDLRRADVFPGFRNLTGVALTDAVKSFGAFRAAVTGATECLGSLPLVTGVRMLARALWDIAALVFGVWFAGSLLIGGLINSMALPARLLRPVLRPVLGAAMDPKHSPFGYMFALAAVVLGCVKAILS